MAEAHAIIDAGTRQDVVLRLTGGLAVRHYAIDLEFAEREYSDIDLIGLKRQVVAVGEVFRGLGYVENRHVAMATGNGQLQFFLPGAAPASAPAPGATRPATTCPSSPRSRPATTSTSSSTPCAWTTRSTSATGWRSTPTPSTRPTSSSASSRSST